MPRGDGTGPKTGREVGKGSGGRGRGGGFAKGPGGNCICPKCGERVAHQLGASCYNQKCPKCGSSMTRE